MSAFVLWITAHWRQVLAAVVLVAIAGALLATGWHFGGLEARAALARLQVEVAQRDRAAADQSLQWSRALAARTDRALEDAHARQTTIDQQAAKLAAARGRIVRLAGDADRLRDQLAAYAAGAAGDSLAACRARAGGLADLLAESDRLIERGGSLVERCLGLAAESARAAQQRAVDQDTLYEGWPRAARDLAR